MILKPGQSIEGTVGAEIVTLPAEDIEAAAAVACQHIAQAIGDATSASIRS